MDDLAQRLAALAPEVDEAAARRSFDRARNRRRVQRRAAGVLAAMALLAAGVGLGTRALDDPERRIQVDVAGPEVTTTAVPTDECRNVRVDQAPRTDVVTAERLQGETTGDPRWRVTKGEVNGQPAADIEIGWYPGCVVRVTGDGLTRGDLDAIVDGFRIVDAGGRPLFDPAGAVWPETAVGRLSLDLPDWRVSAAETARRFVGHVYGEASPDYAVGGEAPDETGRCEKVVVIDTGAAAGRVRVGMSRAVAGRFWSVCEVTSFGEAPAPFVSIRVEARAMRIATGSTARFRPGNVSIDYGGRTHFATAGLVNLPFTADTTGSVVISFASDDGTVQGLWARPLPANDAANRAAIGDESLLDPRERAIVGDGERLLGWFADGSWVTASGALPHPPFEAGETVVELSTVTSIGTTRVRAVREGDACYGNPDADIPVPTGDAPVVRASWDVQPRPVERADDGASRDTVEEALRSIGLPGQPIEVTGAWLADLDGDGRTERIVTAKHPDQQAGVAPQPGWYGIVVLAEVVDDRRVVSVVDVTHMRTVEPEAYPTQEDHEVRGIGDLNGDGTMEIVTRLQGFEWYESAVHETNDRGPGTTTVLRTGCGV